MAPSSTSETQAAQRNTGAEPGPPFRSLVGPILLLTGAFALNFIARVVMAPLMPAIETDLSIGHAAAGGLFFFISLGYCAGLLSSGAISARLTHRRTIILSSIAVGLALWQIALSPGLFVVRLGMVTLGFASGLYLPCGVATITQLVPQPDWGRALAIHELAPNISFAAAPLLVELLLTGLSWRGALAVVGGAALIWGLVYIRAGKGGDFPGTAPNWRTVRPLLHQREFWLLATLFTLALGMSLGVYTMLPLYLVNQLDLLRPTANAVVAASRLSGVVMLLAGGRLVDHLGARRALLIVFLSTGALTTLLGILPMPWALPAVLLQPMFAVCFFPIGFAALSRLSPLAVSFVMPIGILAGAGLIPAAIGWVASEHGFGTAMTLCGITTFGGALVARILPTRNNGRG